MLKYFLPLLFINPLLSSTIASEAAACASSAAAATGAEEGAEALPHMPGATAAHAFGDLTCLPDDVLRNIAPFLSLGDIARVGSTCKERRQKLAPLYQAHLSSRLSTYRDTYVMPLDLRHHHLRSLKTTLKR